MKQFSRKSQTWIQVCSEPWKWKHINYPSSWNQCQSLIAYERDLVYGHFKHTGIFGLQDATFFLNFDPCEPLISTWQSVSSSKLSLRPRSQQTTVLRTLPILTAARMSVHMHPCPMKPSWRFSAPIQRSQISLLQSIRWLSNLWWLCNSKRTVNGEQ